MRVLEGDLRRYRWGEYRDTERLIVLAHGMTRRAQRSVLAHEVAHAVTGDRLSLFGPFDQRQERRARLSAATMLVSCAEYAAGEALYGPHVGDIADELDVLPEVIHDWRIAVRTGFVTF